MKKKALALILIMMLAITGCGASGSDSDSTEKKYASEFDPETNQTLTYGDISFEVPKSWSVEEDEIFVGDKDGALAVTVQDGDYDMSKKENQEQAVEICAESYDDVQEVSQETLTILDGTTAFYYVFTGDESTVYTLWFSLKDQLYMLVYEELDSSPTSYVHDFESVIDSLKET